MKTLILTVGLPQSGKSTWAQQQGHPIVNRDSIRLALHGQPYVQSAEEMVAAVETLMVRALFMAGHETVIVDATHATEKRRRRWDSDEWEIEYKSFHASKETCIKRALANGKEYLIPVIERMAEAADFWGW